MSYRAMGDALGKPHTTIRSWVKADFPRLFHKLAEGSGNHSPEQPANAVVSLDQERIKQAHEAARTLQQTADVLTTAEARGELVRVLEGALRSLRDGTKPVAFSDF